MKKDKLVDEILSNKENTYLIHYSCQNLNDSNEGYSPRITSIAVLHLKSSQMNSFSVHTIAEELKINKSEIVDHFDAIEKIIVERFFKFAESKGENVNWVHWNMKNINFGFEHLEHRYRILTAQEPFHINEKNRYNLSSMLNHKYGPNYAAHPKMLNLMELNGEKHRDFLTGEEEVSAFKAGEFVKMHKSTMCKVYFFEMVLRKMQSNELKTETNRFKYLVNELYKHPVVQIIGIVGIGFSIVSAIIFIIQLIKGA